MDKFLKIVNPKTNRQVYLGSKLGRSILQKYLDHQHETVGGAIEEPEEVRLDEGDPISFFHTIEEADEAGMRGSEFCVGEMPVGAWFTYDNQLNQIVRFDNDNGVIIAKDQDNTQLLIDASDNATYWGRWENRPQ